jgi:chromosome segregation ATPase
MAIDVLDELDQRIQASVGRIQQLQKENENLAKLLEESERRCADMNAQLKQRDTERNEVKVRIEKILTRFDGLDLG